VPRTLHAHIPLHRLWAFATFQTELTLLERTHVIFCHDCCFALVSCINAESFGAVLTELENDDDDSIAKAS
jgi:hypothetical protein